MPQPPRLSVVAQPFGQQDVGSLLTSELASGRWQTFRGAVAFLKSSGLRHLAAPLDAFLAGGGTAKLSIGIDLHGTSLEGLEGLWRVVQGRAELHVFKEGQGGQQRTFHPKGFLFESPTHALAVVGSGNLTGGGLYTNHELGVGIELDRADPDSAAFLADLVAALDAWHQVSPACLPVDAQLLIDLAAAGELLPETAIAAGTRAANAAARQGRSTSTAGRPVLFGASGATSQAPAPPALPPLAPPAVTPGAPPPVTPAGHTAFLIEVIPHHNAEILLSKRAVDQDPGFFGWPFTGWTVPKRRGNPQYPEHSPDPQVEVVVHDTSGGVLRRQDHSLNFVYYSRKSEFRITIPPALAALIPPMSLMVMTRNPTPAYDYRLAFHPPASTDPAVIAHEPKLVNRLPTGGAPTARRYGWA